MALIRISSEPVVILPWLQQNEAAKPANPQLVWNDMPAPEPTKTYLFVLYCPYEFYLVVHDMDLKEVGSGRLR